MDVRLLTALLLLLGLTQACTNDNLEDLYPEDECADYPTENVTYNANLKALLDFRCGNDACHSATSTRGLTDYTNYVNLKSALDVGRFQRRVFEYRDMPHNQTLTPCEMDQIQAWVDQGYPEN